MPGAPLLIKICGLSTSETLEAALTAGADMVGFVFFPPSPRSVSLAQASALGAQVRGRAMKVALSVDADDALLDEAVASLGPDMLQFHGRESPARVAAVKARYGLPIMKALHVSARADLAAIAIYEQAADRLLFDARPPQNAVLPGGNGTAFDWSILKDVNTPLPWMLSGGLTPDNVTDALRRTGARGLDVSSGVETAPGIKSTELIARFLASARAAAAADTASAAQLGSAAEPV